MSSIMPKPGKNCVLTIDGGSSSIKFALYEVDLRLNQLLSGEIKNIGQKSVAMLIKNPGHHPQHKIDITSEGYEFGANWLIDWLDKHSTGPCH